MGVQIISSLSVYTVPNSSLRTLKYLRIFSNYNAYAKNILQVPLINLVPIVQAVFELCSEKKITELQKGSYM